MHFADVLTKKTQELSPVCVGLDPNVDRLPKGLARDASGVLAFGKGIIDAVRGIAPVVKLQMAYYERLGWEGMKSFFETCTYAKEQGLLVIADGKRNDIGPTCEAYADAYLSAQSPIDALTVSPYLGSDGVKPFIDRCAKNDKGIFVLVKTSNASSGELQDLPIGDEVVHEHMAQLVDGWGEALAGGSGFSAVGAVVGATYPEELSYLRTLLKRAIILIPGYGAQGGTAKDILPGFVKDGTGAIVNSSRGIIFASNDLDWKDAARKAAEAMKEELQGVLRRSQIN